MTAKVQSKEDATLESKELNAKSKSVLPSEEPIAIKKDARKRAESESDDDAEEILEESPCKRWSKRREQVKQRDVPGIDVAYLAMDNETGNEVVWNEVQFSERKNFRAQEENINSVFNNLMQLVHTNLVKFHKYWTDAKSEKPRVIFITEYMSCGSMSRFLTRTRKNRESALSIKAWKKWCTQILSALIYLHSCDPPIAHGNLSCNTIFIQQNGLIKIGCVAPNAIHHHVKTFRENMKNMHYIAPEFESVVFSSDPGSGHLLIRDLRSRSGDVIDLSVQIGVSLQMAVFGKFGGNGDGAISVVTPELVQASLDSIEDPLQKLFIANCLQTDPLKRLTARQLLFHAVLFEVHSLKLLAAHRITNSKLYECISEDEIRIKDADKNKIVAEILNTDGSSRVQFRFDQIPALQRNLDKFLEDVSNGIFPLTAFSRLVDPAISRVRDTLSGGPAVPSVLANSTDSVDHRCRSPTDQNATCGGSSTLMPCPASSTAPSLTSSTAPSSIKDGDQTDQITENRRIVRMSVHIKPIDNGANSSSFSLTLMLKLEDMMNRQLTADIDNSDDAQLLADELVQFGLIKQEDGEKLALMLKEALLRVDRTRNGTNTNTNT